jgi:hypothetical protein
MLLLVKIGVFLLMVSLLNLLNHFISYLSSCLLACFLNGPFVRINSYFCKS